MGDAHIPGQPVDVLDLQIEFFQLYRIPIAHLFRQQGVGVQRIEHQPAYGDGHPGLLAEPVGDGAFGALGIEQAETDPDKEQQEGKGVEQAAQPGIHQCFPPVSVAWSGIRVVIP